MDERSDRGRDHSGDTAGEPGTRPISPRRVFSTVFLVGALVEGAMLTVRRLVLPGISGVAGVALDVLVLPALIALILLPIVVPLHQRLAGRVASVLAQESELRARTERLEFDSQLRRALETTDDREDVLGVVERAAGRAAPDGHTRLLLPTELDDDELATAASHVPTDDSGCCAAAATSDCPAVRNGQDLLFRSADALDTCPMLLKAGTPLTAVCHPITILGETAGVLTTSAGPNALPDAVARAKLDSVAARIGNQLSLIQALEDSRRLATTDPLTGLPNRRVLQSAHARARRAGDLPSLLLCDLDHFKRLNDKRGHDAGDAALISFADVLRATIRPEDVPARVGGEEFAILLPNTDAEGAVTVAERIRIAQARDSDIVATTTVSIGVAGPRSGPSLDALLRRADEALYAAKSAGRDTVKVAEQPPMATSNGGMASVPPPQDPEDVDAVSRN